MPSWSGHIHRYAEIEESVLEKKLTNIQNFFDFIHLRAVAQGISKWPLVLAEAYRCLKPGGCIELSEIDSKFVLFLLSGNHHLICFKHAHNVTMVP
jgi:ubiquinone/menaquinone biosynthesis C-methylase UbiE